MAREIDPKETSRASAFELWMQAPNPMVTFFKTLNVSNLIKISKKRELKFNMLMCYCIGKAAASIKEFYMLPANGILLQYDTIAVSTIVKNDENEINSCDIPYSEDLKTFNRNYLKYTAMVAQTCQDWDLSKDSMIIGTSAIIEADIDGAVGMSSGIFNNPFNLGKIPEAFCQVHASRFVPVPSHPNGRGARRKIPHELAKKHRRASLKKHRLPQILKIHILLFFKDTFGEKVRIAEFFKETVFFHAFQNYSFSTLTITFSTYMFFLFYFRLIQPHRRQNI